MSKPRVKGGAPGMATSRFHASKRLNFSKDGDKARPRCVVLDKPDTDLKIAQKAFDLPCRRTVDGDLSRQLFGLLDVTGIERRGEQGWTKPRVGKALLSGPLAGRDHNLPDILCALLVSVIAAEAIEPWQVTRAVILVEVEIHSAFISVD